jgi:hypothetical protein
VKSFPSWKIWMCVWGWLTLNIIIMWSVWAVYWRTVTTDLFSSVRPLNSPKVYLLFLSDVSLLGHLITQCPPSINSLSLLIWLA